MTELSSNSYYSVLPCQLSVDLFDLFRLNV